MTIAAMGILLYGLSVASILTPEKKYSDNTISRWEHAEITPTIETLQKISEIYDVPLEYLLKENITENLSKNARVEKLNKLSSILLMVSVVWFVAVIAFIYGRWFCRSL